MSDFIGKLFLSFATALQPMAFAADVAPKATLTAAPPAVKAADPVVVGVRAYNMIQGANRLFLGLKAGANTSDEEFLDRMADKYKGERLPLATAKDGAIWLQGINKPIKVIDLKKGQFSYDGKAFDLTLNEGIEKSLETIEKTVFPKTAGLWNWILPKANATISDPMMGVAAIMGVGGLAMLANSCGMGPEAVGWQCGLGGFMGGFGLGYILTALLMGNKSSPPTGMQCYPGSQGCGQMVLRGANGMPINTISQCPGQGYNFNPPFNQVPAAQGQYMAQQLSSFCSYPGMMGSMNTAYMAPVPTAQWAAPVVQRQVAPPFAPFSAPKKPATTIKAATVPPPSSMKAQGRQTPANSTGGAAK